MNLITANLYITAISAVMMNPFSSNVWWYQYIVLQRQISLARSRNRKDGREEGLSLFWIFKIYLF